MDTKSNLKTKYPEPHTQVFIVFFFIKKNEIKYLYTTLTS